MLKKQFFLLNWDIGIQRKLKDSGVMDAVTNMNVKKTIFFIKLGYRDTEKTKRFWGHGCCNKYEC